MKRMVAIVVLVVVVLNCGFSLRKKTPSQQVQRDLVVQSEQVGKVIVIDAERREQLELFPGIEGFKEAQFIGVPGGGYKVEIVTDTKRLVSVNRDPNAMIILLDFVDHYQKIKDNRSSFEAKWRIIDYDTLGAPITQGEVDRIVSPARAASCGCGGGALAAVTVGVVVAAIAISQTREAGAGGADMGVGIGIMFGGLAVAALVAAIAGVSTGCLTGQSVYKQDKKKAVEEIKEDRKPGVIE